MHHARPASSLGRNEGTHTPLQSSIAALARAKSLRAKALVRPQTGAAPDHKKATALNGEVIS